MKKWNKAAVVIFIFFLAGSGLARVAKGDGPLRIVLVPERNIFEQQRKYQNLCDYMGKLLPVDIRFEVLKGYREVLLALKERKAEGAFMGSFVAAYGIDNFGLIPLVRPVWPSGESHYSSYIFKRSGLPVTRDVTTWRGRSFVFVGPHTSAGYFFPLSLLLKNGVKEPGEFFSRVQFAGSHDAAVWMVANGMADMGAAKNTVFEEYRKRRPEFGDRLEILYTGGHFPDSTLVVRSDLQQELREAIRTVFLRMDSNREGQGVLKMFGAMKFVGTSPVEFGDVRRTVAQSGFDITSMKILDN